MIRRFNYTGRKSIDRSRVIVALRSSNGDVPQFDARVSLDGLRLPTEARVYLEAYYRASWMRFAYGTVGGLLAPADRTLRQVDRASKVYFRLLVVDESGQHGLILASADGIRPLEPDEEAGRRESLLPVVTADLGDEVWRVHFEPAGPVLEVNSRIPEILSLVRNDVTFLALVYPAVLRQVLVQLALVEGVEDPEPGGWEGRWLKFARTLHPVDLPSFDRQDIEPITDWIDAVAGAFARKHGAAQGYQRTASRETD